MDAEKLGAFIAENRKASGMTQADLAKKLQVTDKAVSRWERGIGFPDINSIEPLAHALGVSVLEIMKSEKMENNHCSDVDAVELMKSAMEIEKENRKQAHTATGLAFFTTAMIAVLAWLAGFGSIGGSIFFGAVVSVAEVAIYYFLENREDAESRRIYAVIGAIALVGVAILLGIIVSDRYWAGTLILS